MKSYQEFLRACYESERSDRRNYWILAVVFFTLAGVQIFLEVDWFITALCVALALICTLLGWGAHREMQRYHPTANGFYVDED